MTTPSGEYTSTQLAEALRHAGIAAGDTVFLQANLAALGELIGAGEQPADSVVLDTVRSVIGDRGTLLVPSYTFSFCRREPFDPRTSPAVAGPWSPSTALLERVRRLPGAIRSADPIHSVAGVGPAAAALLESLPPTCFGPGSVFERLRHAEAKICLLGLPLEEATIRHHSEAVARVPFRYDKLFTGDIVDGGRVTRRGWVYFVRLLADNAYPDGRRLEARARSQGVCRAARLGAGEVLAVGAEAYHRLTLEALAQDPWFTARGPAGDPVALEEARTGACRPRVRLPRDASLAQMVEGLWYLPRHLVSDGYDAALEALAEQVEMTIHRFPTGQECWTWLLPEKWTCHEAWLERLDGARVLDVADHPLHVVSYSLPFEGEVSREELLAHLHVHPRLPDAVPFMFKYYDRDWGLCCSAETRDALTDERYRVRIRTDFSFGHLKVGEVVVPGRTDETIVLCAHLCHPAMVNDDLSGVVVGIDVMRALRARRDLRYTYRFLIVPETIGSVAFLANHPELVPRMRGGLFLEMLGVDQPHALQLSFDGDTLMDHVATRGVRAVDPEAWTAPFRTLAGNDERQFNAPGLRVPMLSLSRMLRPDHPQHPYREYHSSHDTPAAASMERLAQSRDAVLSIVDTLERAVVPVNRFHGEVFCSRYGLHIDPFVNPEGHRALFDIMFLVDGQRSVDEIAERCGIAPAAVSQVIGELHRHGLVAL